MMQTEFTLAQYDEAADFVRAQLNRNQHPQVGLVLGSGLGPLAEQIESATVIPYENIPNFPVSTVDGHAGRLVIGQLAGVMVCAMQGRFHLYEGYSAAQITLPVRVMKRLGINTLIVTNAAGGINPAFQVGDLMLIEDHINLLGISGNNPLRGPNVDEFGVRFPPMNHAYTPRLRHLGLEVAAALGVPLQQGVYAAVAGPNFETPAEIRFLRIIGADAVGMSTAPEAIVAHHAGMELLAISSITNVAIDALESGLEPSHEEIQEAGQIIVPRLTALLLGILPRLSA